LPATAQPLTACVGCHAVKDETFERTQRRRNMMMRKLLTTTALAIGLAMPVTAQTDTQGTQTQQQTQGQTQAQGMQIMVSSLIGRTLYMPGQSGQMGDSAMSGETSGEEGMTEQERREVAEGGVEGEAEELEQSAENTAEDIGDATEAAWNNLESEVTDAPDEWERVGEIDDVIVTEQARCARFSSMRAASSARARPSAGSTSRTSASSPTATTRASTSSSSRATNRPSRACRTTTRAQAEQAGEMRATENPQFQEEVAAQGRGPQRDQMQTADWDRHDNRGASRHPRLRLERRVGR
jgi:hypothetical protein